MQEDSLFLLFARPLNRLEIPYMVTGAVATILYGEPRLTHDIDLVVEIARDRVGNFCKAFPLDSFYCPPEEVLRTEIARRTRGHFNLLHHQTGFRADVYLHGEDPLHAWGMARRRRIPLGADRIWVAPPEYVILRKLQYYREGKSEKHLRDIAGMLELLGDTIERTVVNDMVLEHGLSAEWQAVPRS